jgi:3-dehydroquinate dehydratase
MMLDPLFFNIVEVVMIKSSHQSRKEHNYIVINNNSYNHTFFLSFFVA